MKSVSHLPLICLSLIIYEAGCILHMFIGHMCFFNQIKNSVHQDTVKETEKQVTKEDEFLTTHTANVKCVSV